MAAPLDGIRVLEAANWLAAPSAAALMADLGADVVKIENPLGDAWRGMQMRGQSPGWEPETGVDAAFELDNRGKRGVALSLELPDAVRRSIDWLSRPTSSSPTSPRRGSRATTSPSSGCRRSSRT